MNDQDRQAIDQLFQKLKQVEGRTGPRDPEAEALIQALMARQPGAPYYLAQTVIMQELALETANQRIEALERRSREGQGGGFLSGLFGGGRQQGPDEQRMARDPRFERDAGPQRGWNQPAGGGFLAGAAQTAMGVAGGVVLGNLLAGALFGGDGGSAGAATADSGSAADNAGSQDSADAGSDAGNGDLGGGEFDTAGDFGDFGDFG